MLGLPSPLIAMFSSFISRLSASYFGYSHDTSALLTCCPAFFLNFEYEIHKCSFALEVSQRLLRFLCQKHIPHVLQFLSIAHPPPSALSQKVSYF